jgi:putative ABC transport system permease protein
VRDEPVRAVWLDGERHAVREVGRADAFPGMAAGRPLVVTRAGLVDPGSSIGLVWGRGDPATVRRSLAGPAVHAEFVATAQDVIESREVRLARQTFSFLRVLAIACGVLALLGLLLYVSARQRSQAIGTAFARRMGLTRSAEVGALALELTALVASAAVAGAAIALAAAAPVVNRIDPLPDLPPATLLAIPWSVLAVAAAIVVAVCCLAAVASAALAARTDVMTALRDA